MRILAICAAIGVMALGWSARDVKAEAGCKPSPSVPAQKRALKPVPADPKKRVDLDLCLGKMVKIKGVTYCYQCMGQSMDVGNNTGQCVKPCDAGLVWNATKKLCCPGTADPLTVPK